MDFVLPASGDFRIGATTVPFINLCTKEANPLLKKEVFESDNDPNDPTAGTYFGVCYHPLSSNFHYPVNIRPDHLQKLLAAAKAESKRYYVKETGVFETPDTEEVEFQPATHILVDVILEGKMAHQAILFITQKNLVFIEFQPDFAYVRGGNSTPDWNDIPAIWAEQYRFHCPTKPQRAWDNVTGIISALAYYTLAGISKSRANRRYREELEERARQQS